MAEFQGSVIKRMTKNLKIFIACEGSGGTRLIRSLLKSNHTISGVLASPKDLSLTSTWNLATKEKIPTFDSLNAKKSSFAHVIKSEGIDLLLTIRFPCIIVSEVLSAPILGSYNLHTGPLPKYAGLNTVNWALYNGESQYGVTLHKIEPSIDTGPIASHAMFNILPEDSALSLMHRCIETGLKLILEFVENISRGIPVKLCPQDLRQRCYYGKSIPRDGYIDWTISAKQISNFVRACDYHPFISPWGAAKSKCGEQTIEVHKGHPSNKLCLEKPGTIRAQNCGRVKVATGSGWFFLDLIKYQGNFIDPHLIVQDGMRFNML